MTYWKIDHMADVLTVLALEQSGQLKPGEFVEEGAYPFDTWYQLRKRRLKRSKLPDLPFDQGSPRGLLRPVGWPRLLRKLGLTADPGGRIGRDVIAVIPDQVTFATIVREHVLLDQGWMRFAMTDDEAPRYLLRVREPALWSLMRAPDTVTLYNAVPAVEGLFLQRGHRVTDELRHAQLSLSRESIVLFDGDRTVRELRGTWHDVSSVVDLAGPEPTVLCDAAAGPDSLRITIPLRLVDAPSDTSPTLFRADDIAKLERVLQRTPPELLLGVRAWIARTGEVWILADERHTSRGILAQLDDLFAPYICLGRRVFVPAGKAFLPRLDEGRVLAAYSHLGRDYLCATDRETARDATGETTQKTAHETTHDSLELIALPAKALLDLDKLVEYRAEQAVRQLEPFESTWQFDLRELIKTATTGAGGGRGADKARPASDEPERETSDSAPRRDEREDRQRGSARQPSRDALMAEIREVDRGLSEHHTRSALWHQRSMLSARLGDRQAALVAFLSAACLEGDDHFVSAVLRSLNNRDLLASDLAALFVRGASEEAKGEALARIRRGSFSAEETYALQLYYAWFFHEPDVFDGVVEAMHRGFPGSHYRFCQFDDYDASVAVGEPMAGPDSRPGSSSGTDGSPANGLVDPAVHRFIRIINEESRRPLERVIIRQLNLMLRANGLQGLPEPTTPRLRGLLETRYRWLASYGKNRRTPRNCADHTEMWLENVEMSGLRETRVEELFVGDVYRPVLTWDFVDQCTEQAESIFERYSSGDDGWSAELLDEPKATDDLSCLRYQRLVLYLVTRFGPLRDFERFILPWDTDGDFSFYRFVVNCDHYRLCLLYDRDLDENELLTALFRLLPEPRVGYTTFPDFRDAAENLLLCLFLSGCTMRQSLLEDLLRLTLAWLDSHQEIERALDEFLGLISYIAAGFLYREMPQNVGVYRFYAKKKGLWMSHAHRMSQRGFRGFLALHHHGDRS